MSTTVVVVHSVVYIDRSETAAAEMKLRFAAKKLYRSVADWLETSDVKDYDGSN